LDSGGNYHGYIGDLCRMAIHGEPDAELEDLLAEIEQIQRASMKPIKAGVMGSAIYAAAEPLVHKSKHHNHMPFLAHGMGLVSHEAPRLTATGPVPYDAYDADRPLESGMVVSVETTLQHPQRGFIKLEDTVVVTGTGFDIYGEGGRGWNRGGTAVRWTGGGKSGFERNAERTEIFSLNRHGPWKRPPHAAAPCRDHDERAMRRSSAAGRCDTSPGGFVCRELNAQREQRDCADPYDQDHQGHRVVVEPMPALYTHDAPRPERPTHSSPGSP